MFGTQTPFSEKRALVKRRRTAEIRMPFRRLRLLGFMTLVILSTLGGVYMMHEILSANGTTLLEAVLLFLFSLTFGWITISFWTGIFGFLLQLFRIDPMSLTRRSSTPEPGPVRGVRTAVVMPIYNEDTQRVIAGFESSMRSLEETGEIGNFDFFLLSDTQDPEIAQKESDAWAALLRRLGPLKEQAFYRRREKNTERKVGNLADFCKNWGHLYEGMIVLDADSIMTGDCMLSLARALRDNPKAGLIQTVPIPVRQDTFFGRFLQFAATLYSPMLATGLAFWQTDNANYWGHNAIIRVRAFSDHCGLPSLTGKGPFSGDILSHDFVEAALLSRAGWDVILLADLEGSYEEVPSNILDYATRDRRWVQGNIQHLALLRMAKARVISRLHFLLGATAYISSVIWLSMLMLSTVDAVSRAVGNKSYFTQTYQLFPDWPIAKTSLIFSLISITVAMLVLPKILGVIVALVHKREEYGGAARLIAGSVFETIFAILIAPLMMLFHAYFVISVFLGRKVSWNAQPREGRMVSWSESFRRTRYLIATALIWGSVTWYFSPVFFYWMCPVLLGLLLSTAIVRYSSSLTFGKMLRAKGLFLCPNEVFPHKTLIDVDRNSVARPMLVSGELRKFPMPPIMERDMPIQNFRKYRRPELQFGDDSRVTDADKDASSTASVQLHS